MRMVLGLSFVALASPIWADEEITIVPLVDGMTITTKEGVIAPISVRVQSLGPGFCASRVSVGDHSVEVLAPPLTWSDWYEVTSVFSSISHTVSKTVLCDTDIIGEVRYYAQEE